MPEEKITKRFIQSFELITLHHQLTIFERIAIINTRTAFREHQDVA